MPSDRFCSSLLFCLVLPIGVCFTSQARAGSFLELETALATDSLTPHPFLINPATYRPATFETAFFFLRGQYGNTYKETTTGNVDEQENDSSRSIMGLAVTADVGSGLGIGLTHQIINQEEINIHSDRGSTEYVESYQAKYSTARAVVEVTERVSLGFIMRFLDASHELVGSFLANPSSVTSFSPSFFGSGGGFHLNFDKFQAGGAYIPPMKGSAEIYSEEKIITVPGIMELSLAGQGSNLFGGGVAVRRWLYKKDDRPDGTTLDDQNQTAIDLLGLNVDHNLLFPREQRQIGLNYRLSDATLARFGVSQYIAEFNPDPDENLPGENEGNELLKYLVARLFLAINNKNMTFLLGVVKSVKKSSDHQAGGRSISYTGRVQNIILGIQARL